MTVASEADTQRLARLVGDILRADDFVSLSGDLGAGKTTFARALIRHLTGDVELEVPSPTFTLLQVYEHPAFPIVHADLYRIRGVDELAELGWDEAAGGALVLVEWPERITDRLPPDRLDIAFRLAGDASPNSRSVMLTGRGAFAGRLAQAKAITVLLEQSGFMAAERRFMSGDASTRAYEHLVRSDGRTAILMISPPRNDAPAGRLGKPYHHVARLAGDIRPFLAIDRELRAQGISAPDIYAADAAHGVAVIEDLGKEPIVRNGVPVIDRYLEVIALLAGLHDRSLPEVVAGTGDEPYRIPHYDLEAYLIEAELVIDWYAPHVAKTTLPASARGLFVGICERLFGTVLSGPKTWCLRDVHWENLFWLGDRQGWAKVGVIDFQDAVIGHPAYDVVSLLQDARVTIPDSIELRMLGAYAQHRRGVNAFFDMPTFAENYAILGVQRATKILGGFARLAKRDRKANYLHHIPRVESYLLKGLAHPALAELRAWYQAYLPGTLAKSQT